MSGGGMPVGAIKMEVCNMNSTKRIEEFAPQSLVGPSCDIEKPLYYNPHPPLALRADQRVNLVDLLEEPSPTLPEPLR